MPIAPNSSFPLRIGTVIMVRKGSACRDLGVTLGIEHLNGAPFQSGARRGAASSRRNWILLDESSHFRGGVMGGCDAQILTVEAVDERTFGLAQPGRVLGQCLENGLEVQCGAADHLE